jgi:nucleoside-diphosphate-sugar epimerase
MLRRPLVTGAGGFIGFHLAQQLSKLPENEFVYVVDLPNSSRLSAFENNPKFHILRIDLSDFEAKSLLPENVTCVFALAAMNGTGRFYTHPNTVLMNSTLPTITIIEKYITAVPIVYTSSSEIYASATELFDWKIPTDESVPAVIDDVHNPRWSYATAKLFGEVALVSAAVEFGGTGAIVRYHNVYGPDMGTDHFVPDFIGRALNGIKQISGAHQTRAFMYVEDAILGTILAAKAASPKVPIFHLGADEEIKIIDAAKIILDEMDLNSEDLQEVPAPIGSVSRRCADTSKAKNLLGWEAKVSFRQGIKRIL